MSLQNSNNPFVGLRPFESDESLLFFGRQEQTLELLQRLHQHHFVAIVGGSGSGKSSLVRAGLIPRLKGGYLVDERDRWMISIMKPGQGPLYNLSAAIIAQTEKTKNETAISRLLADISEKGANAITGLLKKTWEKNNSNFFLLVDQFEELFRFSMDKINSRNKDEAIDFVNIMLGLTRQKNLPIYVVITMRSDFIGDCAQFFGLPEAMNQSQYLVPRLNRVQLKNVIEDPVKLYGGKINPTLTSRLLNDIQSVQDELPLLQHVLMRTWDHEMMVDKNGELNINDYQSVGEIKKALSDHADEAMQGMTEKEKELTKKIFQALTAVDENGRKIRRPVRLSELMLLTGSGKEDMLKIINRFIENKRSFLIINKTGEENDQVVDISHESLIRQWETLSTWVDEESDSAKNYLQLTQSARLFEKGRKDLLMGNELIPLQQWFIVVQPTAPWAKRYNTDFEKSRQYLLDSEKEWELEEKRKRNRKRSGRLVMFSLAAIITVAFYFFDTTRKANKRSEEISRYARSAESAATDAKEKAHIALQQKEIADTEREKAIEQKRIADSSLNLLVIKQGELNELYAQEARKQKNNSESFRLIIAAETEKTKDPTVALRITEAAMKLNPDPFVERAFSTIFTENNFYKIIGRHPNKGNISSVAYSPEGKYILTGSEDQTARLWDLSGNVIREFKGHPGIVRSVAYSPDGKSILTGSDDNTARLWLLNDNTYREFKGHSRIVRSVAYSPDGKLILTGSSDNTAILWNLKGDSIQKFRGHSDRVRAVAFSPDGKFILTGSDDKTARLWDLKGNTIQKFPGHSKLISSVAFSPDGNYILTGSEDLTARLWDLKGKLIQEFKGHSNKVRTVAFSPDEKHVLTGSDDNTARLWNLQGNTIQEFIGHTNNVRSVAFSPDGKYIITGSSDETVRQWGLKGNSIQEFKGHLSFVRSVAFSPDGKYILSGSEDNTARLWDLKGNSIQEFRGHKKSVRSVAFSPDGKYILTGSDDYTAMLWDLKASLIREFKGHSDTVRSVAFSPDGKYILTGSYDKTARLWDMKGNTIRIFKGHTNFIRGVAFSPDGKSILTGSYDKTARLWNLNGELIREFKGHTDSVRSVAFSPDGKYILTGSNDNTARLWDLKGNTIREFRGHLGYVRTVAFSPDGRYVLSGSNDNTARLWDLEGRTIQEFKGHLDKIRSVAFSPDGKYILTGSDDFTARMWNASTLSGDFLGSDKIETLTPEQKKQFGIK